MSSPNDLTSLADLKTWLGISSGGDDSLLSGLITEISVAILADLGRSCIRPSVYTETRDGAGEASLVLRHWPVNQLLSLTFDGLAVPVTPSNSLGVSFACAMLDATDPAPPGGMQRVSVRGVLMPRGFQNVAITYRAGYEVAGEIVTVPTVFPYTVNAASPYGGWQSDGAVSYTSGAVLLAGLAPGLGVYTVSNGVYTFSASDAGATVVLRYGYVPADLARCCREWAAERYSYRARIGQSSKSLGGQETAAFIVKAMPDFVSRVLQPYRRVAGP